MEETREQSGERTGVSCRRNRPTRRERAGQDRRLTAISQTPNSKLFLTHIYTLSQA